MERPARPITDRCQNLNTLAADLNSCAHCVDSLDRHCCRTLTVDDSLRESVRLDRQHELAITRPLPHHKLVQPLRVTEEARVVADPLPGNACLHA